MPFMAEKAVFANRKSFYGFIWVASTFFVYASLWILCAYRLQFEITNCILQETLDCLNKKWLQTIQVSTWASIITWRPYILNFSILWSTFLIPNLSKYTWNVKKSLLICIWKIYSMYYLWFSYLAFECKHRDVYEV